MRFDPIIDGMKYAPIPLALTFWVLTAAHAASAATPPANLLECTRISDPGERLKCYDTQMAAPTAAASPPAAAPAVTSPPVVSQPAVSPPPAPSAAPRTQVAAAAPSPAAANPTPEAEPTPEQKFGIIGLPRAAREKVVKPDNTLQSTIASIREVRPKLWLIVLANGQTWLQDGTQITMFFRPGYDVRIDKGMLEGEFRMSTTQTGAKNWVRVSRVQ
jgi:hypothetical protein